MKSDIARLDPLIPQEMHQKELIGSEVWIEIIFSILIYVEKQPET